MAVDEIKQGPNGKLYALYPYLLPASKCTTSLFCATGSVLVCFGFRSQVVFIFSTYTIAFFLRLETFLFIYFYSLTVSCMYIMIFSHFFLLFFFFFVVTHSSTVLEEAGVEKYLF